MLYKNIWLSPNVSATIVPSGGFRSFHTPFATCMLAFAKTCQFTRLHNLLAWNFLKMSSTKHVQKPMLMCIHLPVLCKWMRIKGSPKGLQNHPDGIGCKGASQGRPRLQSGRLWPPLAVRSYVKVCRSGRYLTLQSGHQHQASNRALHSLLWKGCPPQSDPKNKQNK